MVVVLKNATVQFIEIDLLPSSMTLLTSLVLVLLLGQVCPQHQDDLCVLLQLLMQLTQPPLRFLPPFLSQGKLLPQPLLSLATLFQSMLQLPQRCLDWRSQ